MEQKPFLTNSIQGRRRFYFDGVKWGVLYKKATNVLLKHALMTKYEGHTHFSSAHKSFILATTIAENEPLMKELFNARPTIFKPTIPHLTYQYNVYVNCRDECEKLKTKNLELI